MVLFLLFFIIIILFWANTGYPSLIVYDDVTSVGKKVKLKALVKGRLFPQGGELIEFYIEGRHIGTHLSGGDGYAFLYYKPLSSGIKTLKIKKDSEEDEGILLVTNKNDKVLLIEIEGTLFENILLLKPLKEGIRILKRLSRKFRIIYLTKLIGISTSRKWLKDNDFPASAVLRWKGVNMIEELQERMIKIYAIIASPDLLSELSDKKIKKFSFEDTEHGVIVKDWRDLYKRLLAGKKLD
jgi:hypothetical protein